jgi:hypothetical protein
MNENRSVAALADVVVAVSAATVAAAIATRVLLRTILVSYWMVIWRPAAVQLRRLLDETITQVESLA